MRNTPPPPPADSGQGRALAGGRASDGIYLARNHETSCSDPISIPDSLNDNEANAIQCEVLNNAGCWIAGYQLLRFGDDGLLTIRSIRTGATRQLPPQRWRDPLEVAALAAIADQG